MVVGWFLSLLRWGSFVFFLSSLCILWSLPALRVNDASVSPSFAFYFCFCLCFASLLLSRGRVCSTDTLCLCHCRLAIALIPLQASYLCVCRLLSRLGPRATRSVFLVVSLCSPIAPQSLTHPLHLWQLLVAGMGFHFAHSRLLRLK